LAKSLAHGAAGLVVYWPTAFNNGGFAQNMCIQSKELANYGRPTGVYPLEL